MPPSMQAFGYSVPVGQHGIGGIMSTLNHSAVYD